MLLIPKMSCFNWNYLHLLEFKEIRILLENTAFNKVSYSLFSIYCFSQETPEFHCGIKILKVYFVSLVLYL